MDENVPYARGDPIDIRFGYDPHDPARLPGNVWRVLTAARRCNVIYVPRMKSLVYTQVAQLGRRFVAGRNVTPPPSPIRSQDSPHRVELKLLCNRWIEASDRRHAHVVRCTGNWEIDVVHHAMDTEKWGPHRRDPHIWARFGVPNQGL